MITSIPWRRRLMLCLAVCALVSAGCGVNGPAAPYATSSKSAAIPYLTRRAEFRTRLTAPGPSKQPYRAETPPQGVQEVEYPSGDLKLKAWLYVPKDEGRNPHPAIVFFHGGFAFGASELYDCLPFAKAGYVVMTPMLRGENGLPGNFETCYGEVDDGVAAVKWLASQDFVRKDRIYTFGHSSGGIISSMLSLMEDVPITHGGSVGGLYGVDLFDNLTPDRLAFDQSSYQERQMRVLPGNLKWMKRKHYAFIGKQDGGVIGGVREVNREIAAGEGMLTIKMIEGDHGTSYPIGMQEYLRLIETENTAATHSP